MIPRTELDAHIGTHSTYRNCQHDPVHEWSERGDCIALQASDRKRVKQVYGTHEIPHLWAHKTQASARNPQHNLYFENETIYSYGHHFPIAKHYRNKSRACVLFTTDRHSVTTSGHCHSVAMAIPDSIPVFSVPIVLASHAVDHERNLADYLQRIERSIRESARARSSYRKESAHDAAVTMRQAAKDYARFFRVPCPTLPVVPAIDSEAMSRIRKAEAAKAAKEAEATKRRKAEAARFELEKVDRWRAGDTSIGCLWDVPVMLRIRTFGADADVQHAVAQVETSRGARVPVSHAVKALAFVRNVVKSGQEFVTNGHTFHIGEYKIDRVEANGTLHAGCHVIPYPEIERIAPLLEKIQAEAL